MKFRLSLREPVNGMTHFVGAVLSVVGLVVPLVIAIENRHGMVRVFFDVGATALMGNV